VGRPLLFGLAPDVVEYPLLIGELTSLQLGVNQLPVHGQLKTPTAGGDQFQVADALFEGSQQLARQTDGLRLIVSHRTVLQLHIHEVLHSQVCLGENTLY
jgi:hypothetical protein